MIINYSKSNYVLFICALLLVSCGTKDKNKEPESLVQAEESLQSLNGTWNLTSITCDGAEYFPNSSLLNLGGLPAEHKMLVDATKGMWKWTFGGCYIEIEFAASYPSLNVLKTVEGTTSCAEAVPNACTGIAQCDDSTRRSADNPYNLVNDSLEIDAATVFTVPVICPAGTSVSKLKYKIASQTVVFGGI